MRKNLIKVGAAMLLCSVTAVANAQTKTTHKNKSAVKVYYKAGAGYAFAQGGMVSDFNGAMNSKSASLFIFNMKPASFSAGVNANVSAGMLFNKHIGAELGLQIGVANKKYTSINEGYTVLSTGTGVSYKDVYTGQVRGFTLVSPAIVMQTGGEKVNGYTRLGVAIPVSNTIYLDVHRTAPGFSDVYISAETTMRMALGITGAVGAYFKIGKDVSFFCEVNMLSLSPKLKERNITSYIVNHKNYISSIPENDKRTLYEYSASVATPASSNLPKVTITEAMPYSNVGITVGLAWHI